MLEEKEMDDKGKVVKCEHCGEERYCELIPLMGYSEWWCESCYKTAVHSGEIHG
jgi:hypothetical protein